MNEQYRNIPEVTPGLATPEITPTIDKGVPPEVIDGAYNRYIKEENEIKREEIKKPTLH
jgi:hypothetical protein